MKLFAHRLFTHRRVIIIFLLAIFLPSLVAAYLSLSTFPKRREAVRKLLESNLWISGESALNSVEGTLAEYEQKALKPDNYRPMIRSGDSGSNNSYLQKYSEDSIGQYFLLNADFKVVCPETFDDNEPSTTWEKDIENSQFAGFFKRAEYFEFNQKDYFSASEMYKKFATYSSSDKLRAMALEGLGRCFLFMDKYDEATRVYREVARNFGLLHNNAGQPFGIAAAFQLSEIASERNEKENSLGILLVLYKQIREGIWSISQPSYDFYITEIETALDNSTKDGKFPEIQGSYLK